MEGSDFMTYEVLLETALKTQAITQAKLAGVGEHYPRALDVLLRLPSFCGSSSAPDDDWFPWWCHTQYCAVGISTVSLFDLWQRGFYVEAAVLLRHVLEIFVQVRYFHSNRSALRLHLKGDKRVRFKTMFEALAPGYYDRYYGTMLSGVAHGGLPSTTMRLDLSKGQQAPVIRGCSYNENMATWVLNQLTPLVFGLLKLFPEFFPECPNLIDTNSARARSASVRWLSEVMASHQKNYPQTASWYSHIEKLVCWRNQAD